MSTTVRKKIEFDFPHITKNGRPMAENTRKKQTNVDDRNAKWWRCEISPTGSGRAADVDKWAKVPRTNQYRANAFRFGRGTMGERRSSADDTHVDDIIWVWKWESMSKYISPNGEWGERWMETEIVTHESMVCRDIPNIGTQFPISLRDVWHLGNREYEICRQWTRGIEQWERI